MSIPALLSRNGPLRSDRFQQPFVADLTLGLGRVHEFCGDARRRLALMLAARMTGDVFWIAPAWEPARLNPQGFHDLVEPARITFVTVKRAEDLLWCMEEVLRSGVGQYFAFSSKITNKYLKLNDKFRTRIYHFNCIEVAH